MSQGKREDNAQHRRWNRNHTDTDLGVLRGRKIVGEH